MGKLTIAIVLVALDFLVDTHSLVGSVVACFVDKLNNDLLLVPF